MDDRVVPDPILDLSFAFFGSNRHTPRPADSCRDAAAPDGTVPDDPAGWPSGERIP
jgi:hypothetical protein